MEEIILVGYGGHAKSVADCIERQGKYHIAGYTDHMKQDSPYEYLGTDDVLKALFDQGIRSAVVSVGYLGKGTIRKELYSLLKDIGFCLPVIVDPSAIISQSATIGEGSFISKGAIVNTDSAIGKMTIVNTNAVVEHNCSMGDFSHIAVGAVMCGGAQAGEELLIGANATILQNVQVGNNCVIGAGAVLNQNISDNIVVVGIPAKPIQYS